MKTFTLALLAAYAAANPIQVRDVGDVAADVPDKVTIGSSSYSGTGCPQGSVSTIISDDKTVITFGFDRFQAVIGPRSNQNDKTKNCRLALNLRYPPGFQMSIMQATYHGYVRLDDGVTADFFSSYFFSQAADKTANSRATLRGPEYKNGKVYEKKDVIENASTVWSPCGANGILNINNRIALTSNGRGEGEISTDDATVSFTQKIHVTWRRCNKKARYVEQPEFDLDNLNTTIAEIS